MALSELETEGEMTREPETVDWFEREDFREALNRIEEEIAALIPPTTSGVEEFLAEKRVHSMVERAFCRKR